MSSSSTQNRGHGGERGRRGGGRGKNPQDTQKVQEDTRDPQDKEWQEVLPTRQQSSSRSRSAGNPRGGRGRRQPALGSRRSALSQAPDATGEEPIFKHKHIHFMFNRMVPDEEILKQTKDGFTAFVDEFRQSDGTFKENYGNPDFKPRYCLISGQGPHVTSASHSDGNPNLDADKEWHITGTFMDTSGVQSGRKFGQDIHIKLDRKTNKILKHTKEEPNHSWGFNPKKDVKAANQKYIIKNIELGRIRPDVPEASSPPKEKTQPQQDLVAAPPPTKPAWGKQPEKQAPPASSNKDTKGKAKVKASPERQDRKGRDDTATSIVKGSDGSRSKPTATQSRASSQSREPETTASEVIGSDGRKYRNHGSGRNEVFEYFSKSSNSWKNIKKDVYKKNCKGS